mgnify:FL=1|tara:strand:- start:2898 stop:3056 length:159 start_codon:yes stop_codon:yes gene_type:complete
MAKKAKKEIIEEAITEEPVVETPKEESVKTFRDQHGRTWKLDKDGNRIGRVK